MTRRLTRVMSAAAVAAAAALATATPALAHATLKETEPARGTTVKLQPKAIVFHFSERVEMNFSAVHVYNASGKVVDDGHAVHPAGVSSDVSIGLKPKVTQGTYTATYRVISADGHPVSGGFVFSIGKAGAAPALTVAELAGGSNVGRGTTVAFGVARAVQYGAIAIAIGQSRAPGRNGRQRRRDSSRGRAFRSWSPSSPGSRAASPASCCRGRPPSADPSSTRSTSP